MVYSLSLSLSLSLILSSAPSLSSLPLSRARALNEAGGQRQCAANWPSLPGAPAACDWSVQWGPTVQPPLQPSLFHSNRQDARCTPVCLSLVSSPRGHFIFTHIPSTLSSFIFISCHVHTTKGLDLLWIACLTCHYMFLLLNIYLLCPAIFWCVSSFTIGILFSLPDLYSHTLSQHSLTFLGLCHPHTLSSLATVGFGQLLRSPIGQQPEKKKKKNQLPAPVSFTMGSAVPALAKLYHTVLS